MLLYQHGLGAAVFFAKVPLKYSTENPVLSEGLGLLWRLQGSLLMLYTAGNSPKSFSADFWQLMLSTVYLRALKNEATQTLWSLNINANDRRDEKAARRMEISVFIETETALIAFREQ